MTSNSPELGRDKLPGGPEGPSVVAVVGEALIDLVPAGREGLFEAVPGASPSATSGSRAPPTGSGATPSSPASSTTRWARCTTVRSRTPCRPARTRLAGCSSAGAPPPCPTTPTAVHCSWAPPRVRDRIEGLVALADVVKVSAEDLAWLLPGRPPEHVAEGWLAKGPAIVAVTLGPGGVMAVGGAGIVRRPGRRVAIVDTVGAGDSFMSMLLAGLHPRGLLGVDRCAHLGAVDTDTLSAVLDEAVLASAIICTRHGVGPPIVQHLSTGRP